MAYNISFAQYSFNSLSNPIDNILNESFNSSNSINIIQPSFSDKDTSNFYISLNSNNFYNSGHPNIDNNSEIIAKAYLSNYLNYSIALYNNFFYLKFSPSLKFQNNSEKKDTILAGTFSYLNDKISETEIIENNHHLRESTFAIHFRDIGLGISNESMWIGPGFHSSLSMSNNSAGFKYYFLGTLRQKRIGKFGFNFRYFISERNNAIQPFFHNSLSSTVTYYGKPVISLGFNRTYLSGGFSNISWSINDASKLVFEPFFGSDKKDSQLGIDNSDEPKYWDPWDQLFVGFMNIYFPLSKTHFYFELGTDDHRENLTDLKAHWDHSIGYILGVKKFGIFGNKFIFLGIELMSNKTTANTLKPDFYRGDSNTPNFYSDSQYLFSSYNGRRWAAHSGSDSDDRIIMIGFLKDNYNAMISYNFERRGAVTKEFPEKKNEIIIRINKKINYFTLCLYYENEKIYNYNFRQNKSAQKSNVIGLGLEYNFIFH